MTETCLPRRGKSIGRTVELAVVEEEITKISQKVKVGTNVRAEVEQSEHQTIEAAGNTVSVKGHAPTVNQLDEESESLTYAEGILEEMGVSFQTKYGGNYALIDEGDLTIDYVVKGDSSLLHSFRGERVSIWGRDEKSSHSTLKLFKVTDISYLD